MTLVYLDNSHLGKLSRKYPSINQQITLNEKLKNSGKELIYSLAHIMEITNHADEQHVVDIGNFMQSLPHQWIRFSDERIKNEIAHAWGLFSGNISIPRQIFTKRPVDILPPTPHILEIIQELGGKKLSDFLLTFHNNDELKKHDEKMKLKFPPWAKLNEQIAQQPGWESKLKITFKQRLLSRIKVSINTFVIDNHTLERFADYLISNSHLIKSYLPEFHTQHMILKNRGEGFNLSDVCDLEHFSAAPYVNVFSCDKRMMNDIKIAQKKFNLELENITIFKNDYDVENFLLN